MEAGWEDKELRLRFDAILTGSPENTRKSCFDLSMMMIVTLFRSQVGDGLMGSEYRLFCALVKSQVVSI